MRQPFQSQSYTEQFIINSLKKQGLPIEGWKITTERKRFFPRTQGRKIIRIQEELGRLLEAAKKTGEEVDSVHLRGEKLQQWKLGEPSAEVAAHMPKAPQATQTVSGQA